MKKFNLKKPSGKSRKTIIVVVAVLFVILLFWYLSSGSSGGSGNNRSTVAPAPHVRNVPGSKVSPQYYRALVQSNAEQAKQAQSLGQSSVATLLNTASGFKKGETCSQHCCACQKKSLKETVSGWLADGKISKDTANTLAELSKKHLSASDYASALDKLVKEGKLTPEQARELLAKYKQAHGVQLAKSMDGMIKSGALPLGGANKLLSMRNNGATVDDYAAELARMVKSGKISKATAAKLLAQYKKLHGGLQTISLDKLIKMGLPNNFTPGAFSNAHLNTNTQHAAQFNAGHFSGPAQMQDAQVAGEPNNAQEQALLAAHQSRIEALSASMKTQATSIIKATQPALQAAMVSAPVKHSAAEQAAAAQAAASADKAQNKQALPYVKAGDIQFAVLDTAVNSDYPTSPVMATIVQGKLKGARLIGKLSKGGNNNNDRVILTFNLLNMPSWPKPVEINAVAISPQTARSAMATSVDHHYLARYGALFASAFLEGYGDTFSQAGQVIIPNTSGKQGQSIVINGNSLSPAQRVFAGLGKVGQQTSSAAEQYFDTPPTVRVKAGVGLGILFLQNVTKTADNTKHNKGQKHD